jgi:hypothetical protein
MDNDPFREWFERGWWCEQVSLPEINLDQYSRSVDVDCLDYWWASVDHYQSVLQAQIPMAPIHPHNRRHLAVPHDHLCLDYRVCPLRVEDQF